MAVPKRPSVHRSVLAYVRGTRSRLRQTRLQQRGVRQNLERVHQNLIELEDTLDMVGNTLAHGRLSEPVRKNLLRQQKKYAIEHEKLENLFNQLALRNQELAQSLSKLRPTRRQPPNPP